MSKTKKGGAPSNALSAMRRQEHHCIAPTLSDSTRTGLCAPRELLSDFLCHELGVTGTHVGCEYDVCGVYTMRVDDVASRSYLILAVQADDRAINTVEGPAAYEGLNDLQEVSCYHHTL